MNKGRCDSLTGKQDCEQGPLEWPHTHVVQLGLIIRYSLMQLVPFQIVHAVVVTFSTHLAMIVSADVSNVHLSSSE